MSSRRTLVTATITTALVVSGCSAAGHRAISAGRPPAGPRPATLAALTTFGGCDDLLRAVKSEAAKEVAAYGWLTGAVNDVPVPMPAAMPLTTPVAGALRAATSGAAGGAGAPEDAGFSTTNNQENGVDEPDLAKTDGRLLVLVHGLGLQVLTVGGPTPQPAGRLDLGGYVNGAQLFLSGSLAVVIGASAVVTGPRTGPASTAVVVSLADPIHPRVERTFHVPGEIVDARMLSGRVVLVVRRSPDLALRSWWSMTGAARVRAHNRRVVARSGISDWLPPVTTTPGNRTFAPACDATWHSAEPDGVGTVDIVSLDPADEGSVHQTTIVGDAGVVYASASTLYLASGGAEGFYGGPGVVMRGGPVSLPVPAAGGGVVAPYRPATTRISAFDLRDPATPHYLGSGVVPGTIVDQYSLSEYDGDLRVATTVGVATPPPGEGTAPRVLSDNRVTVLRPVGHALVQVGQLRGLGRGERIYGVRFLDDIGYVVTFRSLDPLFVLDLSDPAHPREVSHLELTGYSAYLHPLGDGLLFGLGRRVTTAGRPLGEQLSVFDVSTPSAPSLRSRLYDDSTSSPAEDDHHAFLWWAKDRLIVLPMWGADAPVLREVVYHVSPTGVLERVGAVRPPGDGDGYGYGGVERALVIGDVLYVVADQGVLASDLHSLKQLAWIPLG